MCWKAEATGFQNMGFQVNLHMASVSFFHFKVSPNTIWTKQGLKGLEKESDIYIMSGVMQYAPHDSKSIYAKLR